MRASYAGTGGFAQLIAETSPLLVVFGSYCPFFYFKSAVLKVRPAGLPHNQELPIADRYARSTLNGRS